MGESVVRRKAGQGALMTRRNLDHAIIHPVQISADWSACWGHAVSIHRSIRLAGIPAQKGAR
jgi:hypothetical protein